MYFFKKLRVKIVLFLAFMLVVIVFSIWSSMGLSFLERSNTMTEAVPTSAAFSEQSAYKETSVRPSSKQPVPGNFPAPAKKLHQLINDSELSDEQSLEEKIQQLNKQLVGINKQLKIQGVDVPEQSSQTAAIDSDTTARLNAIKTHLNSTALLK